MREWMKKVHKVAAELTEEVKRKRTRRRRRRRRISFRVCCRYSNNRA